MTRAATTACFDAQEAHYRPRKRIVNNRPGQSAFCHGERAAVSNSWIPIA
jgi:hypothetical protein